MSIAPLIFTKLSQNTWNKSCFSTAPGTSQKQGTFCSTLNTGMCEIQTATDNFIEAPTIKTTITNDSAEKKTSKKLLK